MSLAPAPVPRLVVVGSVGLDTIRTPWERRSNVLGGSASYACAAASFFARAGMVGVVGADFPAPARALFRRRGIDLAGLQTVKGRTFRWSGVYERNMDVRRTLRTDLNVFADFSPELPEAYRRAPFLFLANIAPALQLHVLDQMRAPRFVVADTMDLWIRTAAADLGRVIGRVDLLTVNESEARHLTGAHSLLAAARELLRRGPSHVLVKKGENGSLLLSRDRIFLLPAFPLEAVRDPTGAGDTFAGGFMGRLARDGRTDERALRRAMLYGSVVASFGVEAFGLDCLRRLTPARIEERAARFRRMLPS
jgi:sugar/nucleoside kinase (ribokinase family)